MIRYYVLTLFFCCGRLFAQDAVSRQSIDGPVADYLQFETYSHARLSYNKVVYPDASLRMDLFRDELIVKSPENYHIVLFPESVDFVEIHDYHIIYFQYLSFTDVSPNMKRKASGKLMTFLL